MLSSYGAALFPMVISSLLTDCTAESVYSNLGFWGALLQQTKTRNQIPAFE